MPEFEFTDEDLQKLLEGIFAGRITPLDLPQNVYYSVANFLKGGLYEGLGTTLESVEWGSADAALLTAMRENIYVFSAARTWQQTAEMSAALTDEAGVLRTFSQFETIARDIFAKYNGILEGEPETSTINLGWLKTEYSTAIGQAQNAKKWNKIEKEKELFPYLKYDAVGDAMTCDICYPLNGICLPVESSFWAKYMPLNHFGCRCLVHQIELAEGEEDESRIDDVDRAKTEANVPEEFLFNPGKTKEVFKAEGPGQHPYFTVPREYRKYAESNFGFSIPNKD